MTRIDRRKAPLRKVIGQHFDQYERSVERLECGHVQPAVKDIIGETHAVRRRCVDCLRVATAKAAREAM